MPVSACRRYTDAFKTEAVRLVSESGRPAAHFTLLPSSDFPPSRMANHARTGCRKTNYRTRFNGIALRVTVTCCQLCRERQPFTF
jgi:hypothetical protein